MLVLAIVKLGSCREITFQVSLNSFWSFSFKVSEKAIYVGFFFWGGERETPNSAKHKPQSSLEYTGNPVGLYL